MNKGVSIIMCCFNSSKLLGESLKYICNLKVSTDIPWEFIIIDNNSTDDTSSKANSLLNDCRRPLNFKILFQPSPGISHARRMGIDNSVYDYIIFCDDDNWLSEDYVQRSFEIMEARTDIGAVGGSNEPVTNGNFPDWFWDNRISFAAGIQFEDSGDVTWTKGAVWGAGMVLRKEAVLSLFVNDYISLLSDRKGNDLTSGGDIELCYALRLAGWKIWHEPDLKLKHFISPEKLSWKYLRKLNRGFGEQKVNFDPYLKAFDPDIETHEQKWYVQSFRLLKKIRGHGFRKLLRFLEISEGDPDILRIEKSLGKVKELLKTRSKYKIRIQSVRNASWRKVFSQNNLN